MFAIVDIETTGGNFKFEKITDISIFLHDGVKIQDHFCTLINPEKDIPAYISNLTGITNDMVSEAPFFYEVAKKIIEMTKDCVFVAHNVSFDYQFIREEYRRLGYDFQRERLCTLRLSRKFIPGMSSYSLGNLCNQLNIQIHGRHRADGDAQATVQLFEQLIHRGCFDGNDPKQSIKSNGIRSQENALLDKLPHQTGVYQLLNEKQQILYIGKGKDIQNRVRDHFKKSSSKRTTELIAEVSDIGYDITGSELVALLLESHLIKLYQPLYNRAQRRTIEQYGVYSYLDSLGYKRFWIAKNSNSSAEPLISFETILYAKDFMVRQIEKYQLCQKLCGIYESKGPCFHYQVNICLGACIGQESPEIYNYRAEMFCQSLTAGSPDCWIMDQGQRKR